MLALALALACVGLRRLAADTRYDRHLLPGFDAFVYLAMAESPAVFTVGPWGYRILTPALAHLLGPGDEVRAFTGITLAALAASGGLLFLFLRRLGHPETAALLAVLAFGVSGPVHEVVRNGFLAEPLALLLELLLLLALQAGASLPVLALVMVLGELTKEVFVLFLPGVYLAMRDRLGTRRALGSTAALALLVVAVHLGLRRGWAFYPPLAGASSWSLPPLRQALERILVAWPDWWWILGAAGLPLALVGAALPSGRAFLRAYGGFAVVALVVPFAVAADFAPGGARRSAPFLPEDVQRLLIYALPLVLPLALWALGRLGSRDDTSRPVPTTPPLPRASAWLAALATVAAVAVPAVLLDRYRRLDLRAGRDGPLVLALQRESLRFASRLEQGRPVFYEILERRYRPGRDDRRYLERMRWFLLDGFGEAPQYGTAPAAFAGDQASFLVPCFTPRDLDLVVALESEAPLALAVSANGTRVGGADLEASPASRLAVRAPARTLFRGDNVVTLTRLGPARGMVRLRGVTVRPAG